MLHTRTVKGTIEVDGREYRWELRRRSEAAVAEFSSHSTTLGTGGLPPAGAASLAIACLSCW